MYMFFSIYAIHGNVGEIYYKSYYCPIPPLRFDLNNTKLYIYTLLGAGVGIG